MTQGSAKSGIERISNRNPKSSGKVDFKSEILFAKEFKIQNIFLKVEFQIQNPKFFFCDRKPELSLNRHNRRKDVTV